MSNFKVNDKLKQNYDSYYSDVGSEWRKIGAIDKVDNIQRLCSSLNLRSALEIGAGEGSIVQQMSDRSCFDSLCALEISSSGVQNIRQRNIDRLLECKQFDGYNIPYKDKQFDLAILSHVVEHVEHPRKIINEAKRVARYVFIEVPLEDNLMQARDFVADDVGHINFYSPKTIRQLAQTCGLTVIEEMVSNRSKATYLYQNSKTGALKFYIKQLLLSVSTSFASKLYTYHGSIICKCEHDTPTLLTSKSK